MRWALKKDVRKWSGTPGGKTGAAEAEGRSGPCQGVSRLARTGSDSTGRTGNGSAGAKEAPGGALATERGSAEMSLCWQVPTRKGRDGGRQELLSGPERQGGRQEELPLQTVEGGLLEGLQPLSPAHRLAG